MYTIRQVWTLTLFSPVYLLSKYLHLLTRYWTMLFHNLVPMQTLDRRERDIQFADLPKNLTEKNVIVTKPAMLQQQLGHIQPWPRPSQRQLLRVRPLLPPPLTGSTKVPTGPTSSSTTCLKNTATRTYYNFSTHSGTSYQLRSTSTRRPTGQNVSVRTYTSYTIPINPAELKPWVEQQQLLCFSKSMV